MVIKAFNQAICFAAKAENREVSCAVEHIVVIGPPFVAENAVKLIWRARGTRGIHWLDGHG